MLRFVKGTTYSTVAVMAVLLALSFYSTQSVAHNRPPPPTVVVPTITKIEIVKVRAISKTAVETTLRAYLTNSEPRLLNTTATISSSSPASVVVEGTVTFGTIQINQTLRSQDTFTIRHDIRYIIKPSFFKWSVNGTPDFASQEGLITGNAGSSSATALGDYYSGATLQDDDVISDPTLGPVIRTQLGIEFQPGTTVQEANSVLRSIGATIISTVDGSNVFEIAVPAVNTVASLEALRAQVASLPHVLRASYSFPAGSPTLLPTSFPSNSLSPSILDLIAMRAPAAWNAARIFRTAPATAVPRLAIADYFGADAFGPGIAAVFDDGFLSTSSRCDFGEIFSTYKGYPETIPGSRHGAHVLSKIAADFSIGDPSLRSQLTSILPVEASRPLETTVIDLCPPSFFQRLLGAGLSGRTLWHQLVPPIRNAIVEGHRVVLNTSLGGEGPPTPENRSEQAVELLTLFRGQQNLYFRQPIEDGFIHFTSAGNDSLDTSDNASAAAAAALKTDLVRNGQPIERLLSTLVVENREFSGDSLQTGAQVECLARSSNRGGSVSAVGAATQPSAGRIWGANNLGDVVALTDGGTSTAAPQAASLALYMWTLRPDLTSAELARRMVATSKQPLVCDRAPAPSIDVYEALLSLDDALVQIGPTRSPVRSAILDFDDSGSFTEADVALFASAFALAQSNSPPDYGRGDLNGDGYTGGPNTVAFNLNADLTASSGPNIEGSVPPLVAAAGLRQSFDEGHLTDHDILCYYVYSSLFSGDRAAAENALANAGLAKCVANAEPAPIPQYVTYELRGNVTSVDVATPATTVAWTRPIVGAPFRIVVTVNTATPPQQSAPGSSLYVDPAPLATLDPSTSQGPWGFNVAAPSSLQVTDSCAPSPCLRYSLSIGSSATSPTYRGRLLLTLDGGGSSTLQGAALPVDQNVQSFATRSVAYFRDDLSPNGPSWVGEITSWRIMPVLHLTRGDILGFRFTLTDHPFLPRPQPNYLSLSGGFVSTSNTFSSCDLFDGVRLLGIADNSAVQGSSQSVDCRFYAASSGLSFPLSAPADFSTIESRAIDGRIDYHVNSMLAVYDPTGSWADPLNVRLRSALGLTWLCSIPDCSSAQDSFGVSITSTSLNGKVVQ